MLRFPAGTVVTLSVKPAKGEGGARSFDLTLDPEPDGFLTLPAVSPGSPASSLLPLPQRLFALAAAAGFARLMAAPRIGSFTATVTLNEARGGPAGLFPRLQVTQPRVQWRAQGAREELGRLGAVTRVEPYLRQVLDGVGGSVNALLAEASTVLVQHLAAPGVRRVGQQANDTFGKVAGQPEEEVFNDLVRLLGLTPSNPGPAACTAANWLRGFREFRFQFWLMKSISSSVPGDTTDRGIELVAPLPIDFAIRYDLARKVVVVRLSRNFWVGRPAGVSRPDGGRKEGLFVRGSGHVMRAEWLEFEHPLTGVGSGGFTGVGLETTAGPTLDFAVLIGLGAMYAGSDPEAVRPLANAAVPIAAREILGRLNQEVPRVAGVLDALLEQAATQAPPQLQEWIATARSALTVEGTCPVRTVVATASR